jgi:hypothetical protein
LNSFSATDVTYKEKVLKGFQTVKFSIPQASDFYGNALVDRTLEKGSPNRIYNTFTGEHLTEKLSPEQLTKLRDEGYILVDTDQAIKLPDGTRIKTFLVRAKDAEVKGLSRYQLAYRAGGHRFYEGKYFAKQTAWHVQPDTGQKVLLNPNTYVNGTNAEVGAWVEKMEAAREAYNRGSDEALESILGEDGAAQFKQDIKDGNISADTAFEVKYDREMPTEYVTKNADALDYSDHDEAGFSGWLRTNGRMYYSGKGDILRDWRGENAKTIDSFKAINNAIMNVANLSSFSDFKITAAERWVNKYKDFLDNTVKGESDYSRFTRGHIRKDVDERVKQAAEAQRDIIRRNIGWKTDYQRTMEQYHRRILEWVGGEDPEGFRNSVGAWATRWTQDHNPIQSMRGWAFDAKLGLFNPGQLFVQAGTMAASIALSPEHGIPAMFSNPALRHYLFSRGSENVLDAWAKKGVWKMGGYASEGEFKESLRAAHRSGFFDFGGSHQMINDFGPEATFSGVRNTEMRFRETGRFFFNKMWNRG